MTDAELLADYFHGSQAAFAGLVRRHVDLVYAAARRHTRDAATAEDVTQAVFVLLARKAKALRSRTTVAGWLLLTTVHVSRTASRSAARRARHERAAALPEGVVDRSTEAADSAAVLDTALARLRPADRDAVALRYLEGRSLSEVAATLGVSEEAARKRIGRAVERLRAGLARRGVTVTAAALAVSIGAQHASAAPPAVVTGASAVTDFKFSFFQGVSSMVISKTAAVAASVALTASGVVGGIVLSGRSAPPPPVAAMVPATVPASPAAAASGLIGEYYIGGDITAPGAYAISGRRITVRQALTAARETSLRPLVSVRLIRRDGVSETIRDLTADDITSGRDNPTLQPDDQIIVNSNAPK